MVTSSGLVYLAKKSFKRKRRRGFLKIRSGIATLSFSVHLSQHRAATILGFGQKLKLQMVVALLSPSSGTGTTLCGRGFARGRNRGPEEALWQALTSRNFRVSRVQMALPGSLHTASNSDLLYTRVLERRWSVIISYSDSFLNQRKMIGTEKIV